MVRVFDKMLLFQGVDMNNTLFIVVPCYNEEEVLRETAKRLEFKVKALISGGDIAGNSKIVFVDDGSRDSTWGIIEQLSGESGLFAGIKLSRNRGHQHALLAGLMSVRNAADMVISIDADLQDDIDAIDDMVQEYLKGCDIVYGVRQNREKDSFFKRFTAESYYKLLRSFGCDIVFNHADYRLMSSRALEALSEYREQSLFLRGLVPMLGYKTAVVPYTRGEREAGESKYPLKRMLALALNGLTSLSLRPLRAVIAVGFAMVVLALALLVFSFVRLSMGFSMLDWKIILVSIWGVGGIITFSLGVVGEYVGRAYLEAKGRPRFNIDKTAGEL